MADIVTTDQLLAEISDYWNKQPDSNLYKLVDIYNSGFNDIANDLQVVDDWRAIKDAQGTTLDLIGADEQAYRVTQNDDAYRFWIWIKYLMARAQGTYPSLMKIGKSSLKTDRGFNIWKTGTRHVGVQMPYSLMIDDLHTSKLIAENLQNMIALGYWIDNLSLSTSAKGVINLGTAVANRNVAKLDLSANWWNGWKSQAKGDINLGLATIDVISQKTNLSVSWWSGWRDTVRLTTNHFAVITICKATTKNKLIAF